MAILKDLIVNGSSRFIGDVYFNTIKAGVWNGTAIDVAHGGTGLTSLSSGYLLEGNTSSLMQARKITDSITSGSSYIPTSGAVYSAISAGFAANGAMVYKGTYTAQASSSSNVVLSGFSTKPGSASLGWTWVVTGNNSYFGNIVVEAGDMIISNVSNPGTTISNYYVIQTNIDVTHYVTTNTAQTITGAKTFNAETTFNKQATFNKGLISTSIGDSDTDVLFVSGSSSFNDIVNIYGQTNHGNHVIPMNNNAYDLGSSSLKWRNIYAGSVTATTFTGSLSGNASSATTASSVAWDGVTNKPINFKAYFGSLASGGWKTMQGRDAGKVLSISYNNGVADWNSGTYSASLVYGVSDTRGLLDLSYNAPIVTFGGSSISGSTDDNPSWYMKLTGTSGTTYNLNSMPYATSAGNAGQVKTVTSSSNANYYLTFVDSNNSSATAENVYTNSSLSYNPQTKTFSVAGSINVIQYKVYGVTTYSTRDVALKQWCKDIYESNKGKSVISFFLYGTRGFIFADVYNYGLVTQEWKNSNTSYPNAEIGLPIHLTGRYYDYGNTEYVFGTAYGEWYCYANNITINGISRHNFASIYAPTSAGTSGYLLVSSGATPEWKSVSTIMSGSYLPLDGGTMSGIISWNGATQEILRFANNNSTWYSGLKYSLSSNTTVALWGKNKNTQFVWNTGSDYTSTDINGTSNRNYDFQVGRNTSTDKVEVRTNGSIYSYGYHHLTLNSDNYMLLAGGGYKALSDFLTVTNAVNTYVKKTGDSMSGSLTILTLNIDKSSPTSLQLVINGPTYDANMDVSSLKAWPGIGFHMPSRTYASIIFDGKFKAVSSNFTDYVSFFGAGFEKSGSSNEYVLLGGGGHKAISDFKIGNYLPLDGGTLTGNLIMNTGNNTENIVKFVLNRARESGGGWAVNSISWTNSSNTSLANIGLYGSNSTLSYLYLGQNASYNSDYNLRIYSNKVTFGDNTIWHAGNYTSWINTTNYPGLNKVGTVTSVGVTAGTGISVSNSPITSSGNIIVTNSGVSFIVTPGDNRSVATTPNDYSNKIIFLGLKNKSTIGLPSNNNYSYLVGLRGWSDSSVGKSHEFAFNDTGIYRRVGSTTSWESWIRIADSDNSSLSTSSNVVSLKLLNSTASVYNTTYIDNLSLYANKSTTTSSIALVPTEWKQLCQLSATTLLSNNYGTYVVQITKGTGSSFVFIGSGIMSYGSTNSSALEEIVLHCYGGDDNRLYLGTQNGYLMGAAKVSLSATQYTITFKRII